MAILESVGWWFNKSKRGAQELQIYTHRKQGIVWLFTKHPCCHFPWMVLDTLYHAIFKRPTTHTHMYIYIYVYIQYIHSICFGCLMKTTGSEGAHCTSFVCFVFVWPKKPCMQCNELFSITSKYPRRLEYDHLWKQKSAFRGYCSSGLRWGLHFWDWWLCTTGIITDFFQHSFGGFLHGRKWGHQSERQWQP